MPTQSTLRVRPLLGLASALLATAALTACSAAPPAEPPLQGATIGGDFTLTGENGQPVSWSDFDGRYRIVYFGFTYCPDICPTDVQRSMRGLALFAQKEPGLAAKVQPIFISIDPERDDPAALAEFTAAFSPDLIGLTGTPEQVKQTAEKFAVFYSRGEEQPGGGYLMNHSNITYLFGPEGEPIATLPTDQGAEAVAAELARWVR
ncbi:SCO family protein [Porphyrobacter sp. GA68]|uniref:SCO family protein n=1 Tax=Porphyrobacter sp. GA68 TaxID=2883480 RepID=UPI001D18F40F|nr:SCO family protein [Porphyrobacter sp. GA68]